MFKSKKSKLDMVNTKYIIWGCSGHASVLLDIIELIEGEVIAFIDIEVKISLLKNVPVFNNPNECIEWCIKEGYNISELNGISAIGRIGNHRKTVKLFFDKNDIFMPVIIHPLANVSVQSQIGQGTQILAHSIIAAKVNIGETCIVNHGVNIDHECVIGNNVFLAPGAIICGCVHVEENAYIGAGAIILPRIKIGAGAIVGAGAVVLHDVATGDKVVGNPAKSIK